MGNKPTGNNLDKFIINYHKTNGNQNENVNINRLDQRRLVFVSLLGLYQTYKNVPSFMLYPALLIVPLKRDWIYKSIECKQDLESSFIAEISIFEDMLNDDKFVQLLKWKDSQNFVFWMLDNYDYTMHNKSNQYTLIAPFWQYLSMKLTNLYDPVTKKKYNPIILDTKWWETHFHDKPHQYDVQTSSVLAELFFLKMQYKTIQEILYQSNPDGLNPIISYNINSVQSSDSHYHLNHKNDNDDDGGMTFIDYNPYDIDQYDIDYDHNLQ